MTDETRDPSLWLPNLVGGISIWKLARDLNEAQFFDGRLLVPETEGTDALPLSVRWDVTGLIPLARARTANPGAVDAAVTDFLACLKRVADEMSKEASGYRKYKDAFTVPGLDADGGAYYFFDEKAHKLRVINWGASPRSIAGQQEIVFGWGAFGRLIETASPKPASGTSPPGAATGAAGAAQAAPIASSNEKKKDDDKKPIAAGRPWWHWAVVAVVVVLLAALFVLLFRDCGGAGEVSYPEGGVTPLDARAMLDARYALVASDAMVVVGKPTDGGADGAADAARESGADAHADAREADGASAGSGRGGAGTGAGGILLVPGLGSAAALPRRAHFEPRAVHWRVAGGQDQLDPSSPLKGDGQEFLVILKPSGSFDKVKVQWQDPSGRWQE